MDGDPTDGLVMAYDIDRRTNGTLMSDCRKLGYVTTESTILDTTYGQGGFWTVWKPSNLTTNDLNPATAADRHHDFTRLPWGDDTFDVVVFDPPYKLNGTSAHPSDERYGVGGKYQSVSEKLKLIVAGAHEAARVARKRVLVKCQDQVVSGQVCWQTHIVTGQMAEIGWRLRDRLEVYGHRPQPEGRRQLHARRVTSSLLIFEPWKGL